MVAILVLVLGSIPLFAVNTGSHEDAADAVAFLTLLDRLDESLAQGGTGPGAAAPASPPKGVTVRSPVLREGARELSQEQMRFDAWASFAPFTQKAEAEGVLP